MTSSSRSHPTPRLLTPEFKAEAVRLATSPEINVAQAARDLDVDQATLRSWIKASRASEGTPPKDERSELIALRRENRQLNLEREILLKAAAFFAKEEE